MRKSKRIICCCYAACHCVVDQIGEDGHDLVVSLCLLHSTDDINIYRGNVRLCEGKAGLTLVWIQGGEGEELYGT